MESTTLFATDGSKDSLYQGERRRRAAGYRDVHRDDVGHATAARITFSENTFVVAAAVTDGNDQLRFRRGVVGALQSSDHILRHRTRHQQQVSMARAGSKADAERFEVVVGIAQCVNFEFAAVAGTSIDMADDQRATKRVEHGFLQALADDAQILVGRRRCLGLVAGDEYLFEQLVHGG